ncbi:MAG: DUF1538 family protein [Kiritimatiellia bacterium]|nr:DUF1538 family protein [Kiritimatiellia bacterium]
MIKSPGHSIPRSERIRVPLGTALTLIWGYARHRLFEQARAISFILLYLVGFQIFALGTTPSNALQVAAGIGLVVFGLTFFLEGLLLGLMPLGERVGVQLPKRGGLTVILLFGLLLGLGSTLAEPALAALRVASQSVSPWQAPLLFRLLEHEPGRLVFAIGLGVGIAVALGMLRIFFGLSIKPFIYVIVTLLLAASAICAMDTNLVTVLGLAWDTGAVTTGAVTVPLVLALGLGVSRAMGKQEGATAGFGVIMLASALPILGVLALGVRLNASTPRPTTEAEFFSPPNREAALRLAGSDDNLRRMAFQRGSETARLAYFADESIREEAVRALADPAIRQNWLGKLSLQDWLLLRASDTERSWIPPEALRLHPHPEKLHVPEILRTEFRLSLRAVVPLSALLLIVLLGYLRDIPRRMDEVVLGLGFALIGMALLTSGIRLGLAPLGDEVGRPLPRVFRSIAREEGRLILQPFDPDRVLTRFTQRGEAESFFYLEDRAGHPRPVPYDARRFDPVSKRYEHIIHRPPLFSPQLTLVGVGLVFLFAFGMGFGSTLAEPALYALGRTVEELSVGAIRRTGVVRSVSVGVGIGLVLGVARMLYDLPLIWMLIPPYLALLPLTYWSDEDFAGIAWDCGGVTTGSITVPLVLAMGLGIGGELNVTDGFGVLAMASVYPILTVLLYGLIMRARHRHSFLADQKESRNA